MERKSVLINKQNEEKIKRELIQALAERPLHVVLQAESESAVAAMIRLARLAKVNGASRVDIQDDGRLISRESVRKALKYVGITSVMPTPESVQDPVGAKRIAQIVLNYPEWLLPYYVVFNHRNHDGQMRSEAILRPTFKCNENCHFCWLRQDQIDPGFELNKAMIGLLAQKGLHYLAFSGGEPTLLNELPELIRLAKQKGIAEVSLQTNGFSIQSKRDVNALKKAGLDWVFLALHGASADVADCITEKPGGFSRTLNALRSLLDGNVPVMLNFVMTDLNIETLPEYARFVIAERDRSGRELMINFSLAAPMGRYEEDYLAHTPRLSALRKPLTRALHLLADAEIGLDGLSSACGPPLCAIEDLSLLKDLPIIAEDISESDFVKSSDCSYCGMTSYCHGIRRIYAERFGLDEVRPFPVITYS